MCWMLPRSGERLGLKRDTVLAYLSRRRLSGGYPGRTGSWLWDRFGVERTVEEWQKRRTRHG